MVVPVLAEPGDVVVRTPEYLACFCLNHHAGCSLAGADIH
eukprot:SAG31_NODE_1018_length_10354_cov_10.995514_4_plen_40_part_00